MQCVCKCSARLRDDNRSEMHGLVTCTYNTHTHIHKHTHIADGSRRRSNTAERSPAPTFARTACARIGTDSYAALDPLGVCTLRNALYAPRKRCRRKRTTVICIPRGSDDHCNATRTIRSSLLRTYTAWRLDVKFRTIWKKSRT